ncbi:MAG TPA: SDR family NAD(P)-dependent oxidoreductase [Gaiellaceae bacterium]|nr:SDR family NAD(P)-dependent oxidoreductase [Gaiellaceae bacterium]
MFPRTALVTGAASGIGAAIVELLRAGGAEVQALDLADGFDVADPDAWEAVGAVDLACLNAGVTTGETDIRRVSDEAYRRIRGANLDGVVHGVRRLGRVMEPGSAIVVTASLAGLVAAPQDPLYTLTKHAVVGLVRSVAPQLAALEIRINAVAPGFVDTPLLGEEERARFADAGFPLLEPAEVARAILAAGRSEQTGQVWIVQPGRAAAPFRFPKVPGPRDASGAPVGLPP